MSTGLLLLDTNVVLALVRGNALGQRLDRQLQLWKRAVGGRITKGSYRVRLRSVLAGFALIAGCGTSHPSIDAGMDAGIDMGPDLGVRITLPRSCMPGDEAVCGCIDGFRRCDTCDDSCPQLMGCEVSSGVCRAREFSDFADSCRFVVSESVQGTNEAIRSSGGNYCASGMICVSAGVSDGTDELPFSGLCFPRSYCDELPDASPPVDLSPQCVYSDGSPYVAGPPTSGDCPDSPDGRMPYCGGACGDDVLCPRIGVFPFPDASVPGSCTGLSDDRAFGVCAVLREYCVQSAPEHTAFILDDCAARLDEPCACIVPEPSGPNRNIGFVVSTAVCRDYASRWDSATCRDANWEIVP